MRALTAVALVLSALFIAGSAMAVRAQSRQSPSLEAWNLFLAVSSTVLVVLFFVFGGAGAFAVPVVAVSVLRWWLWWRGPRNRRRKRSLRALGEKTRKAFAAMAKNMPRPGRALRPVPQGTRA